MAYIPYPSLLIDWRSDKSGFTLILPWIILEIDVTEEDLPWIYEATHTINVPTGENVQKFLSMLSEYNIAYLAPRKLTNQVQNKALISFPITLTSIPLETPLLLAQWVLADRSLELETIFKSKTQWKWDLEEICKISQIEGSNLFDPITVVTYLRGLMLEADAETDQIRTDLPGILDQLRYQDEKAFFEFMLKMLRHTHYITQKFQEYAPLILPSFPEATDEINQFLKEEKGHDKLMEHSLKVLGCNNPHDIQPNLETTFVMEIFKKTIEICPMAFTVMIGVFEGGEYGDADPLAQVLEKSSLPSAALGYQRHFEINREENHNNMIYALAQKLPLQTFESVTFTTRILELVCHLSNFSDKELVLKAKAVI